jgi:hypothetical protein
MFHFSGIIRSIFIPGMRLNTFGGSPRLVPPLKLNSAFTRLAPMSAASSRCAGADRFCHLFFLHFKDSFDRNIWTTLKTSALEA